MWRIPIIKEAIMETFKSSTSLDSSLPGTVNHSPTLSNLPMGMSQQAMLNRNEKMWNPSRSDLVNPLGFAPAK
jgi:hypothetical protein